MPVPEVLMSLNSDGACGLRGGEVEERRRRYGVNELPKPPAESPFLAFFRQFNDPIIYVLFLAAGINAVVAGIDDSLAILFVVFVNALIGFFQERRAAKALASLDALSAPHARVLRDGQMTEILTSEVVVGDVVLLESGMRVPADLRIVSAYELLVDEGMLTGEAESVRKSPEMVLPPEAPLGDRLTMAYSGTVVRKGRATGVVVAVGPDTEFGAIARSLASVEQSDSPLQQRLHTFAKKLSIGILAVVVGIFLLGLVRGFGVVDMLMTAVGLAVSAMPEGLPVAVTLTLSIGLYQMARRNAVIRRLAAVETLGSTSVICTDKTGTLTRNVMTVTQAYAGGVAYGIYESSLSPLGGEETHSHPNAVKILFSLGAQCSESFLDVSDGMPTVRGDATEGSIQVAAYRLYGAAAGSPGTVVVPFESERRWMATRAEIGDRTVIAVKGSLDRLLPHCRWQVQPDGTSAELNTAAIVAQSDAFSDAGLRVLALCYTDGVVTEDSLPADLVFVGLVGIEDPPRAEAAEAIANCRSAGVRVIMITGDHERTGVAIGRQLGLVDADHPHTLRGDALDSMSDEELRRRLQTVNVFARVAPEHKLRIVRTLQGEGEVVAMTGDGVNDAPALKQASIGVAMGSGSDVAKDVSAMVVLDDNFASIVAAVRRGRVIFDNLQQIILYILTTSFGGVLTIALSVVFGMSMPILPVQLLWINLVTDGSSTFPLAFEPEQGDVMKRTPMPANRPLVTRPMWRRMILSGAAMAAGTLGLYYREVYILGADPAVARTVAFVTLALFQIFNVHNVRSVAHSLFVSLQRGNARLAKVHFMGNKTLVAVSLGTFVLQIAAVVIPPLRSLLGTAELSPEQWLWAAATAFLIIPVVEIVKFVEARLAKAD